MSAPEPGHGEDNRWVHRPRLDPVATARRDQPDTVEGRVFAGLRRLARTRAGLPQLHASVAPEVLDPADPGVLPVLRRHPEGSCSRSTTSSTPGGRTRWNACGHGGSCPAWTH